MKGRYHGRPRCRDNAALTDKFEFGPGQVRQTYPVWNLDTETTFEHVTPQRNVPEPR